MPNPITDPLRVFYADDVADISGRLGELSVALNAVTERLQAASDALIDQECTNAHWPRDLIRSAKSVTARQATLAARLVIRLAAAPEIRLPDLLRQKAAPPRPSGPSFDVVG